MTNGEKIKAVLKPRTDQIRIYGNWVEIEIQRLDINFSCGLDWWNAEYNEPTTKNDLGVDAISREQAKEAIRDKFKDLPSRVEINTILNELPPVTPQEPILDKIRAEIKKSSHGKWYVGRLDGKTEEVLLLDEVLQIIDKYKAESEE